MTTRSGARLRGFLLVTGLVLAIAGAGLVLTRPDRHRDRDEDVAEALRRVVTLELVARPVRQQLEVTGVLDARRAVGLFTESGGRVIEAGAEELDLVEADQVLVRLDALRARLAVERGDALVSRRESELELARANRARRRSLAESQAVSQALLDDAESRARVAAAALRQARAELEEARDELTRKVLLAPFAGVLRRFAVEVGEVVRRDQEVGELLDLETVRVTLGLSGREIVVLRPGELAQVRAEAYPEERFEGRVLRVGLAADSVTKKFPLEIEIPNLEGRLRPGMVVRATIEIGEPEPRLVLPRDAALEEYGLRFVYVVRSAGEDGIGLVERRRIEAKPLPFRPAELEVLGGLAEGDVIVVSGMRQLRDGERVRAGRQEGP